MRYSVHIGREFQSVPSEVRARLRWKLENICAVLETLGSDSPVMQSLGQSSLTIAVGQVALSIRARRSEQPGDGDLGPRRPIA